MLPVDVILKIAFLLPDFKDVFALIDIFRPQIAFEPLEDLYQLGLTHDHSSLWPRLTLDCSMNDTMSITLYESILKLYSHVLVVDSWYSVDWLKKHLNPTTTIEWMAQEFPVTLENIHDWADLPITRLHLSIERDTPQMLKKALPRMHHLKSLSIGNSSGDIEDIYKIVAESAQITELEVNPNGFEVDNAELQHLIEWFHRQPVRVYADSFTNWKLLDYDLRQELCDVMFNCPTLDRLALTDCDLDDMDFSEFSFSMNTLQLYEFCLWKDDLKLLASRLKDSKLTHLELDGYLVGDDFHGMDSMDYWDYTCGMECLFNALPSTSIKSLVITGDDVWTDNRFYLIPLLFPSNCRLEKLAANFSYSSPKSRIVEALALSIRKNHTLYEFHLLKSKISIVDMRMLIQSISDPSRQVTAKCIQWTTTKSDAVDETTLKTLQEFAVKCGCEFVHDETE
ncbi:hypothetical protein Ae201684P_007362 [Aphanomyces euteiches]|nr:hypothetical protein Ae201684P_007362 [Aphanomyces euteiches]